MKKESVFKLFKSLFDKKIETTEDIKADIKMKTIVMLILCGVSLILTIINVITKSTLMMYSTIVLTVGFAICALLVGFFKLRKTSQVITSILIISVFSYYAWIGGNDGFAILWIAIVPLASMLFMDFALGFAVAVYFLLYIIVIMYILPRFGYIPGYNSATGQSWYNSEFFTRFPALYFASFLVSLFLSGQRLYYQNKAHNNSLFDSMTNLKNRRYYSDYIKELESNSLSSNLVIISSDINNLKVLNDIYGHDYGDRAIIEAANVFNKVFGKYTPNIYRTGGDEFVIFLEDKNDAIDSFVEETKNTASEVLIRNDKLSLSIGYIKVADYPDSNLELLISMAERNMYADKENYYKTFHGERRRENIIKEQIEKELEDK